MSSEPAFSESSLPERIDAFEIIDILGEGGMGTVYLAEQTEPIQRRVAIKVLRTGMDTKDAIARFQAERQAVALMDHPNIARVFDAGTTQDGRPYLAMEYVRGEPLMTYCDRHHLSIDERLALFIPICRAVHHAHQKAIIHRDLKPSNVLIKLQDGSPVPKVIDFGVAKAMDRELNEDQPLTEHGFMVGTPIYMSPEQAEMKNQDIDTTTDVYSLGVLLYELLTGLLPFNPKELMANGLGAFLKHIREAEPPRPSVRVTGYGEKAKPFASDRCTDPAALSKLLSSELDWIVLRAMEKDRGRRYQSALELAADIERYGSDEAVVAKPPNTSYRLKKLAKKHRVLSIALASFIGALSLGLMGITATFLQVKKAKKETESANTQLAWANYVANLQLASLSLDAHESHLVGEYLERCDVEHRGWEWSYLARQADHSIETATMESNLFPAFLSGDGKQCAGWEMGTQNRGFTILDAANGKKLSGVDVDLDQSPMALAFDPEFKWSAGWFYRDSMVRVWSTDSNSEHTIPYDQDLQAMAVSPTGRAVALADRYEVGVWDPRRGRRLASLSLSAPVSDRGLLFAQGDKLLGVGTEDGVEVWKRSGSGSYNRLMSAVCEGGVQSLDISPDGNTVVAGCGDHQIRVFDVDGGALLAALRGHEDAVVSVRFSHDGSTFVSGSRDRTIREWRLGSEESLAVFYGPLSQLEAVTYTPEGDRIVALSGDKLVAFDPERGSSDNKLSLSTSARLVSFPADSQSLLVVTSLSVDLVDPRLGKSENIITSDRQRITRFALSPDRSRLLLVFEDKELALHELPNGKLVRELTGPADGSVKAVGLGPQGEKAYVATDSGTLAVWDTKSGTLIREITVTGVAEDGLTVDRSGSRLALRTSQGLELRKASNVELQQTLSQLGDSPRYTPDGSRILIIQNQEVLVLDASDGSVVATLSGHDDPITCFDLSPDGSRVVTGSLDRTVRLWDVSRGELLLTFRDHDQAIASVEFDPEGRRIVSSTFGNDLILWQP